MGPRYRQITENDYLEKVYLACPTPYYLEKLTSFSPLSSFIIVSTLVSLSQLDIFSTH
ncbi:hypothetical protein B7P43_G14675 [Cryptotermes secundus]|uniref:Uncharacterized protein n=1 Tax=Cryptotermes secundus TaxID=105785 RepID=A0A2J7PFQ3_9NEOP|nr:hypothetical protein B7P43_G14675 [Cryptotermes secundus]